MSTAAGRLAMTRVVRLAWEAVGRSYRRLLMSLAIRSATDDGVPWTVTEPPLAKVIRAACSAASTSTTFKGST
jgi:hypothetical protein